MSDNSKVPTKGAARVIATVAVALLILVPLLIAMLKTHTEDLSDSPKIASEPVNVANRRSPSKNAKPKSVLASSDSTKNRNFELSRPEVFEGLVTVKLANGESIDREFVKPSLYTLPPMTEANIENFMLNLGILASEGNGGASLRKFNLLKECVNAARDEISYRVREREILSGELSYPNMSISDMITANKMTYLLCKGVSDDDVNNANRWFNLALENQSHFARQQYARSYLTSDIAEAGRQYKMLWEQGYTNSGSSLSFVYRSTDFDGPNPSQPNVVKSYAYQLAQDLVNIAGLEQSAHPDAVLRISDITTAQEIARSRLTPQEQQEAEQLASNLVKNNENCCVWYLGL